MPNENHGKKMRPDGRILHSVSALIGGTSYISPEPKRCVERKVLNCLLRIIAKLPPFVGVILQNSQASIRGSAPSSVERADLSSTLYCRRVAKSHAGIFQRPCPVSDATQRHALGRPQRQDKRDIKFRIAGMADNLIKYSRKRRCGKRRCATWPFV